MTKKVAGTTVHYKVVLPNGYDPAKAYPGDPRLRRRAADDEHRRQRPQPQLPRRGREARLHRHRAGGARTASCSSRTGARIFPEFLKMILADYKIQDGKFHIAGPSNGGIAAFHVAAANPQYFLSVTAFPGYMWEPTRGEAAGDLEDVRLHVCRRERRVHVARRDEAGGRVPPRPRGPSRATPSRRDSRTGSRRWPAPTPRACSTDSKKPRRAAPALTRARRAPPCCESRSRPAPRSCARRIDHQICRSLATVRRERSSCCQAGACRCRQMRSSPSIKAPVASPSPLAASTSMVSATAA